MSNLYEIHRDISNEHFYSDLETILEKIPYGKAPFWLGGFDYKMYKTQLPKELVWFRDTLAKLVPNQSFNTTFCQRYNKNDRVLPHKDPKNNIGKTIILVLGHFTGAQTTIENETIQLNRGDVLVQSCFENGIQGPKHSVSPVLEGTRYAFILNTIVK